VAGLGLVCAAGSSHAIGTVLCHPRLTQAWRPADAAAEAVVAAAQELAVSPAMADAMEYQQGAGASLRPALLNSRFNPSPTSAAVRSADAWIERQAERLARLREALTNQVAIDPAVAATVLMHLAPYLPDALPAYWVTEPTTAAAAGTSASATRSSQSQANRGHARPMPTAPAGVLTVLLQAAGASTVADLAEQVHEQLQTLLGSAITAGKGQGTLRARHSFFRRPLG